MVDVANMISCDKHRDTVSDELRNQAKNRTLSDIQSSAGGVLRLTGGIEELARNSRRSGNACEEVSPVQGVP